MKILVFLNSLAIGGTQVNAIELSRELRTLGHDIIFFSAPGSMEAALGDFRLLPSPNAHVGLSPQRMLALQKVVHNEKPNVVWAWDWSQALDAFFSLPQSVPLVVTDMSMTVSRVLPKTPMTTFGIPELVDRARAKGRKNVALLLPPVDTKYNSPGVVDGSAFRSRYGIADDEFLFVIVSRLAFGMKGDSISRSIEGVRTIARDHNVRLILVGEGDGKAEFQRLGQSVNNEVNRSVVLFAEAMLDPRPAYAAANVVIGMGTSALRGMAFGKPTLIVGANGFSAPLTEQNKDEFYYRGIYGVGSGSDKYAEHFIFFIEHESDKLGKVGRAFVIEHFTLEAISKNVDCLLRNAACIPGAGHTRDTLRTVCVWMANRVKESICIDKSF